MSRLPAKLRAALRDERGFTLIELLVATLARDHRDDGDAARS